MAAILKGPVSLPLSSHTFLSTLYKSKQTPLLGMGPLLGLSSSI